MLVLEQGDVNLDSSDKDCQTPLSYTAEHRCKDIVKMVQEQRDINSDSSEDKR